MHYVMHYAMHYAKHYVMHCVMHCEMHNVMMHTEVPLPLCACYDVTGCAERKAFPAPEMTGDFVYDLILKSLGYHSWPMGYVARHYQTTLDADGRLVWPSHADTPRGTVVKVV